MFDNTSNIYKASVDGSNNVVIQNSTGSKIVVNLNDPQKVKDLLLNLQDSIKELPSEIIKVLMERNTNETPVMGANVYLSKNLLLKTNISTENINMFSLGVSVVNLTKEHRYFYEPFFKTSVPFEVDCDTFFISDKMNVIEYPIRLEYGQPFSQYYSINKCANLLDLIYSRDNTATIVAYIQTTLGEIYKSNEILIKELIWNTATASR